MLRLLQRAILIALAAFALGFAAFANMVTRSAPAPEPPDADAIVALTGGAGARIAAAMDLLETGKGARLLISGVNEVTTDDDVRALADGDDALFDCCVDIGRRARSTRQNGAETADWVRANRYRSLIVVTSDYHMPRALIELRSALGETELIAYRVPQPESGGAPWWRDGRALRRLSVEYVKYLVIAGRDLASFRRTGAAAS